MGTEKQIAINSSWLMNQLLQNGQNDSEKFYGHFSTIQEETDKEFQQRLVPVIYLAILMVIGVPGNLSVLLVYSQKVKPSAHQSFILVLGLIDLLSCSIAIPFEITEMRFQYTFYAEGVCKLFRGLDKALTLSSILVLLSLSFNRYRRVCRPLKVQITTSQAYKICVALIGIAVILAFPTIFLIGTRHKLFTQPDNSTIVGHDCSLADRYIKTMFPKIYNGILLLFYTLSIVFLIIIYALIGHQVWFHGVIITRESLKYTASFKRNHDLADDGDKKGIEMKSTSDFCQTQNVTNSVTSKRMGKVTKTALAISIAFVLSFLPNITLTMITVIKTKFIAEPSPLVLALLPTLSRSNFFNNVVNPFIYAIFHPTYRNGLKNLIQLKR